MIILATNVISEILKRQQANPQVIDWFVALPAEECRTTVITIAELLYGLAIQPDGHRRDRLSAGIDAFIHAYESRTIPFSAEATPYYAAIVATRRKQGHPIGVQDAMIAAIARSHGMTLATRNVKDFEGIGVRLVNPWEADL